MVLCACTHTWSTGLLGVKNEKWPKIVSPLKRFVNPFHLFGMRKPKPSPGYWSDHCWIKAGDLNSNDDRHINVFNSLLWLLLSFDYLLPCFAHITAEPNMQTSQMKSKPFFLKCIYFSPSSNRDLLMYFLPNSRNLQNIFNVEKKKGSNWVDGRTATCLTACQESQSHCDTRCPFVPVFPPWGSVTV